ncbi:hypothetical protein BH10PSE7_BH10PSE7_35690 [soil metagenome]
MRGRALPIVSVLAGALLLFGVPAVRAEGLETLGGHCNDAPFDSDGGGISGCIELAAHYHDWVFGVGIVGVEPEQKNGKSDKLDAKGRLVGWVGQDRMWGDFDYNIGVHGGIEGGAADDLAIDLRDFFHDLFGAGKKDLESNNDTQAIAGASGWIRTQYSFGDGAGWGLNLQPYAHAALGNDVVEGGAGLMLALQPGGDTRPMALLLPKNQAYAPTFGGDGIGIFAGVRGVAYDGLYEDDTEHFIAEAGVKAQATLFHRVVIGAAGSCTNKPYDGAPDNDCKAYFQLGGLF